MKDNNGIGSVSQLIERLENDFGDYKGPVWFRGQADARWGLMPSFCRQESKVSESTILKRFKQNANMLLEKDPGSSFAWMFLMQHYELPTRLLDWSESPLVALYFAVENYISHEGVDAVIWALKPCELNGQASIRDEQEEFFIPSFDDQELINYSIETLAQGPNRTKLSPIATIATRNNPRIQAQQGVFTIHHREILPIEDVGDGSHCVKYVIPEGKKKTLLSQLNLLGFSRFSLFPELASIGHNIRRDLV
jgi:hypothetical protein